MVGIGEGLHGQINTCAGSLLVNVSMPRPLVPPGLDQNVEHFALGIHGAPEVDQATIDLEIDLASRPGELHPQALPDPYVSLSAHTAPDVWL